MVVTNAKKIKVSGLKAEQKVYRHHTMHPGGLKEIPYKSMMDKKPDEVRISSRVAALPIEHLSSPNFQIIRRAVAGMLPKNKLRDRRLERLRIFSDEDMGPFKANIIKRWEDGTLPASQATQAASAPSSTAIPTA